jgi:hypothetical protein
MISSNGRLRQTQLVCSKRVPSTIPAFLSRSVLAEGHANVMFALGGRVKGGKVYGRWPGLENEQLNEGRDLTVTTDFRRVLGEADYKTLGTRNLELVFPGAQVHPSDFLNFT